MLPHEKENREPLVGKRQLLRRKSNHSSRDRGKKGSCTNPLLLPCVLCLISGDQIPAQWQQIAQIADTEESSQALDFQFLKQLWQHVILCSYNSKTNTHHVPPAAQTQPNYVDVTLPIRSCTSLFWAGHPTSCLSPCIFLHSFFSALSLSIIFAPFPISDFQFFYLPKLSLPVSLCSPQHQLYVAAHTILITEDCTEWRNNQGKSIALSI